MQLLNRLLVVLFFGLFGGAALLLCYSSYRQQQPGIVTVEHGNDFPGSWIVLIFFTLFGVALCILSIYCLFTSQPIAPNSRWHHPLHSGSDYSYSQPWLHSCCSGSSAL